jgi:hypothetical protein
MRLSWNEIRARAAHFADEWKEAHYEKGQTQTLYNEFFEVFGVTRRRVASFEEPVKKLGGKHDFIDLFWKGVLLVEQKSAGVLPKPKPCACSFASLRTRQAYSSRASCALVPSQRQSCNPDRRLSRTNRLELLGSSHAAARE